MSSSLTSVSSSSSMCAGVAPNNNAKMAHDFEAFYHTVCSDLQNRGEVHSMSKQFSQLTSDEDRMRFVLEKTLVTTKKEVPWTNWKETNFDHKDRSESQRLRNLGNQVYQKNKLTEALEHYSQSICSAPHPPPPNSFLLQGGMMVPPSESNDEGSFTHEELALGFANRSAVLFQMKEYDLCIKDITRAFDNSYPNNLMYKLFERKARCLKALKDYPRALESMKSSEMWMRYSTLSETKSSSFKKEISKQIEQLEEKVAQMSDFSETSDYKKTLLSQPVDLKVLPKVETENKEIPGLRSEVKLVYTEEKGRHLVATEDFKPGEVIIVETPYSSILLPEYYNTHCQNCYQRVMAPIPCWCCAKVRFCSDDCRNESWDRFHKVECQQLNLILDSGVGKNAMLALRILTSSGKIYLEYVINKLREEYEARKNNAKNNPKNSDKAELYVGFNEEMIYDSADYRTIYTLVSNSSHRGVGDLFKRSLMALYLLKILEMTPFFYNGGSDPRNVPLQDKVSMGAVIIKHLQNLPCNAHELSEMEVTFGAGVNNASGNCASSVHEIGAGAFSILSLLNHSCDPNVVRHYYNSSAVVRTIRGVRKGEELLDNYGYHYAVMPKEERQRKLHNQYYFHCACTACAGKNNVQWTIYANLNTNPTLLPKYANEQKTVMAEYTKLQKRYKKAFDSVLLGHYNEALPVLLEYLHFLDRHFARPLREYNDCQEAIKQCYSAIANCYINKKGKKEQDKA